MKRQRYHVNHDDEDASGVKVRNYRSQTTARPRHGDNFRLSVDASRHDGPFPNFRKPVEVGSFSQDARRTFHHDRRQLRFFVKPAEADPGFDLRHGYTTMIQKNETVKEYLDDMLRWLMKNTAKFTLHNKGQSSEESGKCDTAIDSLHTDFVCWRGLLTKMLCTPYERQDDWKIAVTRFRGTYFLCEFETERKKRQEEQMTPRQKEMSYWGWKFEQYVTAVYGGEVDAWDSSIPGDNKYIELKTSRIMQSPRQWHNFKRFKLLKWWAQSFLLGIKVIVSGFRDDEGVVHNLQDFSTQDIPSLVKDVHDGWQPNVCFNFMDHLLSFIKRSVTVDDPRKVYLMEWSPGQDIQLTSMGTQSDFAFLPPWFVQWEGWAADTTTTTTMRTTDASDSVVPQLSSSALQ